MAIYDRKDDFQFVRWAQLVKQRDHYTCQICGRRGVELNAHHMNAWNLFPDERYDLENGICLCSGCHEDFHDIYGRGNNTRLQFEEYRLASESIIKASRKNIKVEKVTREVVSKLSGADDGYGSLSTFER